MLKFIPLVLLSLILSACSSDKKDKTSPVVSTEQPSAEVINNDAQIVNMLMTANTEEMNLAKVAKKRAQNKKVKDYANRMFKDHAMNNDRASSLRNAQGILLTETVPSKQLKIKVEDSVESIKKIKGKKFDKAFIDAQVTLHQKMLQKLDTDLIPKSQNSELKAMLIETKGKIENHLREAQDLKTSVR